MASMASALVLLPRLLSASPLLMLLLTFFISFSIHHHHHPILALAASSSSSANNVIQCRSGWTNLLQTLHPAQINDGYCDCPYDNADEPNTSACSGALDGMWAGLTLLSIDGGEETTTTATTDAINVAKKNAYFHCPQQPNLLLSLSRINDGICDCCDGADEVFSSPSSDTIPTTTTTTSCVDICNEVLAEERAIQAKSKSNYIIGNQHRLDSIMKYQQWHSDSQDKLHNLQTVELVASNNEMEEVEQSLHEAQLSFGRRWIATVEEQVTMEPLLDIFNGGESYDIFDLGAFIISLCALSAEISSDNVDEKERCVALDRASLDLGVLWNNTDGSSGNGSSSETLPNFTRLEPTMENSLSDYANQILLRLDGEKKAGARKKSSRRDHRRRKPKEVRSEPEDSLDDDDDDAMNDSEDDRDNDHDSEDGEGETEVPLVPMEGEVPVRDNETLVKSLLEKVLLDRSLFKKQSKRLLDYTIDQADNEEVAEDSDGSSNDDEQQDEDGSTSSKKQVDPMALTMVKSAISKYLSQITRGETSAASAARFVASVIQNGGDSARRDLTNLAIMTLYHGNVSSEDVAELIYSTASCLRTQEESANESSCAAPWGNMCPPRTVQVGGKTYPPAFLVHAAHKRCDQRQNSTMEVCVMEGDEVEFPTSVSDGYYNYFTPQSRGAEDALTLYFSRTASLHNIVPPELSELRDRKDAIDGQRASLMERIADLEREIGDINDGTSKYGVDGELFMLRDTCHKLEHGKYEYEVCIFGQATQRDIGQKNGGTNLGSWQSEYIEDGQRKLKWDGGTKCWNGPVRSAEVSVTCGAETKLLTADEPETCRYVFTMECPIGCDEDFKMKNM